MSHYTKTQTKVSDKEILLKALKRLGFEFEVGNFTVSQYGQSEKSEILLARDRDNKSNGAVGLSLQKDGTWSMVGDPYHAPHGTKIAKYYSKNAQFATELQTAYAIEEATTKLSDQGYYCSENSEAVVGKDGMITMTFESTYG